MGKDQLKSLIILSHLGFNMVAPILVCILLGNFIDGKTNLSPIFLVIFTILGILTAFRNLYAYVKKME